MPQRQLKSGVVTSIRLARCTLGAQLLFYKLISLVDDYGRFDAHPLIVSRSTFPYGDKKGRPISEETVEMWLTELEQARMGADDPPVLSRYAANGVPYLVLNRWEERVRSVKSRYPDPPFAQMLAFDSRIAEKRQKCGQVLADAGNGAQMLSNAYVHVHVHDHVLGTPLGNKGGAIPGPDASKVQFAALAARISRLEKLGDARTSKQEQLLADLRKRMRELQKKQAAGDFNTVKAES